MGQSDPIDLQVSHDIRTEDVVVKLSGDFDVVSADLLGAEVEKLRPLPHRLVIDLSEVAFIDSSGLQALLAARTAALEDTGITPRLDGQSTMTRRLLELTGMGEAFEPGDPDETQ